LTGGYASDRILARTGSRRLSRQGVAVLGMTLCALLFVAAYFVAQVGAAVTLMSIGVFWAAFGGVSSYSVAIDFGGSRVATVFSTMNMCGSIGSGLFPSVLIWFVQRFQAWDYAILLLAALFVVDAVCWSLLDPRGKLFEESVA
jgi:MFS family permease